MAEGVQKAGPARAARGLSISQTLRRVFVSGAWIDLLIIAVLATFSVVVFYPFIWLVFSSFKTGADIVSIPPQLLPRTWTLEAYKMVIDPTRVNLLRGYVNSLTVTAGTVLSVLFTSSLGGYVFARLDFPGKRVLFYFVLGTSMVPFITLLIPLYLVMRFFKLLNTLWAVWLPGMFASFGMFLCRQFIYGIPADMYDSAKIDGAGDFQIYYRIILPLLRPVLSVLTIFTFLGSFNNYLWPLVIINEESKLTLPLLMSRMANRFGVTDYQGVMAGSVLVLLPPLIVFLIFRRHIVSGIALTGTKA